ncbi:hypothetical protein F4778DRAFT_323465 [Xylariomycetidae sp. FL2044]|nr:hypothetical protein F4778DRAFT_323465 [Xylariomycetidae sp. FL2044]
MIPISLCLTAIILLSPVISSKASYSCKDRDDLKKRFVYTMKGSRMMPRWCCLSRLHDTVVHVICIWVPHRPAGISKHCTNDVDVWIGVTDNNSIGTKQSRGGCCWR